ncbi:MAG TPA: ferredoxin [Acidimicrobiales bacterium]|nr:ferredoxin [Acidimicrobiales bacterium]
MQVSIDSERCQGHGRCYDLAPDIFGADDEGYATVLGDGTVAPADEERVKVAAANCPESAVIVDGVRR